MFMVFPRGADPISHNAAHAAREKAGSQSAASRGSLFLSFTVVKIIATTTYGSL